MSLCLDQRVTRLILAGQVLLMFAKELTLSLMHPEALGCLGEALVKRALLIKPGFNLRD